MTREVFISYSRKDLEKVKGIKKEIEQAIGVECWMDLENIVADADNYLNFIAKGIKSCKVFVFMLSESSQTSRHAIGELVAANLQKEKTGIHVVIVNIDDCEMNMEFVIRFATKNSILWSDKSQKENLFRCLRMWLDKDEEHKEEEIINLSPIMIEGKFGYADESGKVVIPCQWLYAEGFSEGLARVRQWNSWTDDY